MRVLFLDIDGVLNSEEWMRAGHMKTRDMERHINPEQVALINNVLRETGCAVVLSSSWRTMHGADETARCLRARGAAFDLLDATPSLIETTTGRLVRAKIRGDEIREWLDAHPEATTFAIVDDDSDMGSVIHRLVKTTWARGLQQGHADKLIDLLLEGV